MILKWKDIMKGTVLLGVLITCLLINPRICFAAQAERGPEGIVTLEKDKVYEYDLNGDGKEDKIQYKVTANDYEFTSALKLYINDKLCLSRKDHGFTYAIQIMDLDKSDNYLDLYCFGRMESDCISCSFFARYDGEKIIDNVKFDPGKVKKDIDTARYSLSSVGDDGKFNVIIDTPFYSEAIGCYYCTVPFQLKDNKITCIPVKTYSLEKSAREYKYKAVKSFSVYDKAGSKTVVYTVKKHDIITADKLYISKSGKVYIKIVNSDGKTGWIKSDLKDLFEMRPMWG